MDGGGHIVGRRFLVQVRKRCLKTLMSLHSLITLKVVTVSTENLRFVIAMGTANHSLATAKLCWEQMKISLSPMSEKITPHATD